MTATKSESLETLIFVIKYLHVISRMRYTKPLRMLKIPKAYGRGPETEVQLGVAPGEAACCFCIQKLTCIIWSNNNALL